jgi:ribosome-binding factor A
MSMTGRRPERLAQQIRVELAEMIVRQLQDPRIGFATVTRVELSPDLHHARVLVSVFGSPEEQQGTIAGLSSAAGFIRHEIGHRLALRRAPDLTFVLDHGADEGEKIEMLLQKIHKGSAPAE